MIDPRASRLARLARVGLGAAVVGAYLVSAVVSSRLSPLARHPLLDGFQTPQPYRWVNPPPDQASGNKNPGSAAKTLAFANQDASGFVATTDGQAQLIIGKRTFQVPGAHGQTGVHVTITPLDPATLGTVPAPLAPNGNAYVVKAAFQPSGEATNRFTAPVTFTLIYPPVASSGLTPPVHTILWSKDGRTWTNLPSQDAHQVLQVYTTVRAPGYFVVASAPQPAAQEVSRLRLLAIGILVALALFVVTVAVYVLLRRRRDK